VGGAFYPAGMALTIRRLTPLQVAYAERIARERHDSAVSRGLPDQHGFTGDGLRIHRLGAYGEVAVASWLFADEPWELTVDTFHSKPDLPGGIEVRAKPTAAGALIVRRGDDPDAAYVLVLHLGDGRWRLRGWIWGHEAQDEKWLKAPFDREPAFFVPQWVLYPMESLRGRDATRSAAS
jgi:hypothetical protein